MQLNPNLSQLNPNLSYLQVRLPEDWARLFSAELVLALSHLHFLKVVYRDIKPHNIMIDARGHVVLIDYGLRCPNTVST